MGGNDRRPRRLGRSRANATRTTALQRQDKAAVAAAYDAEWTAPHSGQPYHRFWRFGRSARDAVEQALDPLRGKIVLELGAGDGYTTIRLAQAGARVIAAELSLGGLRALRGRTIQRGLHTSVAPLCADAEQLPLNAASVDLVYGENFLMYVNPAAIGREAARVLRPEGRAIFLEPTAHHPLIKLYRRFGSPYRQTAPRYFTLADIATLGAPFTAIHHEEYYLLSVLALIFSGRPFLFALTFRALNAVDRLLARLFPLLLRYSWLTVVILDGPEQPAESLTREP